MGRTALDIAIAENRQNMARMLLNHISTLYRTGYSADPSLDEAIRSGDLNNTLLRLEKGASVALRETRTIQLRHSSNTPTIVGLDNEYLKTLLLITISLEKSVHRAQPSDDHYTGSDHAFLNGSKWLLTCLTQHSHCITSEGALPILPSRVIDVGPPDGSEEPVLPPTQGNRGRYLALSHRWAGSSITKTTKSNLAE